MGTHKKEANRKVREGKTGDGMGNVRISCILLFSPPRCPQDSLQRSSHSARFLPLIRSRVAFKSLLANAAQVKVKGENFYRSAKKVKVLKRLTDGKAQRNARGDITKAASYQSREAPVARVEPNRKWFNNTRVISQDALDSFRSAIQAQAADPTSYLLKQNKLPMSLINEPKNVNGLKQHQAKIAVESQPFSETFGPKAQRKRPKLEFESLEALAGRTNDMHDTYLDRLERAKLLSGTSGEVDEETGEFSTAREAIFSKGTSVRTLLPALTSHANSA